MARQSQISIDQIQEGKELREQGYTWQMIADTIGISRDRVLYHCSPIRKEQVQTAIRKYQSSNYEKVRSKQKSYAAEIKTQQE